MRFFKTNDRIYTLGQKKKLRHFNIKDKLMQYKMNWREHIQRMDDNRLSKKKNK